MKNTAITNTCNKVEVENMVKSMRDEMAIDERIEKFVKSEKSEVEKIQERIFGE